MINFELDLPPDMILLSSLIRFDYTIFISLRPWRMSLHISSVATLPYISNVCCFLNNLISPPFIGEDDNGFSSNCLNWNSLLNGATTLSAPRMWPRILSEIQSIVSCVMPSLPDRCNTCNAYDFVKNEVNSLIAGSIKPQLVKSKWIRYVLYLMNCVRQFSIS